MYITVKHLVTLGAIPPDRYSYILMHGANIGYRVIFKQIGLPYRRGNPGLVVFNSSITIKSFREAGGCVCPTVKAAIQTVEIGL